VAVRKGYNRFFIIFQEEDKGYGIAIDKQPTGYAKIEVRNGKCKITVYAQNLKQEKGPYYFCMINTMKTPGQLIKVGEIRIDEIGKGETWWEYNEENIGESGCSIDKFYVALILADEEQVMAPLVGFAGKDKILWKEKIFVEKIEEAKHEHEHEHEEEHEHERNSVELQPDLMRDGSEVQIVPQDDQETRVLDEEALKFEKYEEELRNQANDQICDETIIEVRGSVEVELQDEEYDAGCINSDMVRHEEEEHKHKEYGHHASIFHELLEQFEEMDDFIEVDKNNGWRWWKIPYNCNVQLMEDRQYPFLCTIFHLNMTYPHIDYIKYYCERGYYYFGIKYDMDNEVKYIMYGIEGRNIIRDQPYMGMTGFGKWMKMRNKDKGLWMMFYNPKTGNFMVEKTE